MQNLSAQASISTPSRSRIFSRILAQQFDLSIIAVAVFLTLLALMPVWRSRIIPLQDYPMQLLRTFILLHYHDPQLNYQALFARTFFPMPYILEDYLMFAFGLFAPVDVSGRMVLSLYIVAMPLSSFYFVRSVNRNNTVLGFFSFLLLYNRYFNKGLIAYILAIPLFLFALGYWWRTRENPTKKQAAVQVLLILLVYLAHMYAFITLFCTLACLETLASRSLRKIASAILLFSPAVVLFLIASRVQKPDQANLPLVIGYSSLKTKLAAALGPGMEHFVSFSPIRDRNLLAITAIMALVLLVCCRRLERNRFLQTAVFLFLVYLCLPDFVSPYYSDFGIRSLIFAALVALGGLGIPSQAFAQRLVILCVAELSALGLMGTWRDYSRANNRIADYVAALHKIPAGESVSFRTEPGRLTVGKINLSSIWTYYYVDQGSPNVPTLGPFGGYLRTLHSKRPYEWVQSTEDNLSDPEIDPGGWAMVLPHGDPAGVLGVAQKTGYRPLFLNEHIALYRKTRRELKEETATRFDTGGLYHDYDYVLFCASKSAINSAVEEQFDPVLSEGFIHLYRRRPPANTSSRIECTACDCVATGHPMPCPLHPAW